MKLTPDVVTELAKLRSNIKALVEEEKELTKKVKDKMSDEKLDVYSPKESPFKFVRIESDRASVSWKDEWIHLAKKRYQDGWEKVMARIQKKAEVPTVTLNIEANENYQGES